MAFPNDVSDVVVFKIHPAIGIARLSKNDDYFVFGQPQANYKSNGLMKRQAVQFRIFAYGQNHVGLGEATPQVLAALGLTAVWEAKVANRKIAFNSNNPLDSLDNVITAEAASNDVNQGRLTGSLPGFAEGAAIALGQITDAGLFIPPKSRAYRRTPGLPVPNFPNHTRDIADNTCDGSISVTLNGAARSKPVLSACILVAPGDYSPDVDPASSTSESLLLRLKSVLQVPSGPSGTIHNQTAQRIDELALKPATGDFAPGFEVSFSSGRAGSRPRGEVPDIAALFYKSGNDPLVDPREMRVRYKPAPGTAGPGAVRGQLTSGLCSPWQTDFTACVSYWTENLPETAFLDENNQTEINIYRRQYNDDDTLTSNRLTNGDDFERDQDKVGVVRIINGKEIETERDPGNDIA